MIVGFEDYKHLYSFDVSGIIHVGAHFGQEWDGYNNEFGPIESHWFEPIPSIFNQLKINLKNKDNTYLYNVALGENISTEEIYIDSENEGQSSSILKPKEHLNQFPHITFENNITIKISKLDSYNISNCNMLVLDTQGYELKVLKGSINTLKNIKYLFTEFNTVEMYDGCPSIEQLDLFLSEFGFKREQTWYTNQNWGDAFYIK